MSFLRRMKHPSNNVLATRSGTGINGHTVKGLVVDKAERYGAAWGFGALKGYYRERFMFKGQGGDLVAGAAFTAVGVLLNMFTHGSSKLAPHFERIGDSGMASHFNNMGVTWGTAKAGRVVQVVHPGKTAVKGLGAPSVLGHIPPAMGGAYLSAEEIARYSGRR